MNIFERKVYRRILGPVHDNKKNWRILAIKKSAIVQKPTVTETIRLHRLHICWFGHVQRMEENRIPTSIIHEFGNNKIER
jgi:hypothetical protein